jgi:hypothetical protein
MDLHFHVYVNIYRYFFKGVYFDICQSTSNNSGIKAGTVLVN